MNCLVGLFPEKNIINSKKTYLPILGNKPTKLVTLFREVLRTVPPESPWGSPCAEQKHHPAPESGRNLAIETQL